MVDQSGLFKWLFAPKKWSVNQKTLLITSRFLKGPTCEKTMSSYRIQVDMNLGLRRVFTESLVHIKKYVYEGIFAIMSAINYFTLVDGMVKIDGKFDFATNRAYNGGYLLPILNKFWVNAMLFRELVSEIHYVNDPDRHQNFVDVCVNVTTLGFFVRSSTKIRFLEDNTVDVNVLPFWLNKLIDVMYFKKNDDGMEVIIVVKKVERILEEKRLLYTEYDLRNHRYERARLRRGLVKRGSDELQAVV